MLSIRENIKEGAGQASIVGAEISATIHGCHIVMLELWSHTSITAVECGWDVFCVDAAIILIQLLLCNG